MYTLRLEELEQRALLNGAHFSPFSEPRSHGNGNDDGHGYAWGLEKRTLSDVGSGRDHGGCSDSTSFTPLVNLRTAEGYRANSVDDVVRVETIEVVIIIVAPNRTPSDGDGNSDSGGQ